MAVTSDARGGAGGEKFGIRVNSRAITAAAMEKVGDARKEWAASRGGPGRLLPVHHDTRRTRD